MDGRDQVLAKTFQFVYFGFMGQHGTEEITCEHCRSVNIVEYTDYPEPDNGIVTCARCGSILLEWEGTRDYGAVTLKPDTDNKS